MDINDLQAYAVGFSRELNVQFQRIPGSAILLRYIKSSYQNDPVRSVVELFLFLFAVRYLLSPSYSTQKQKRVELSEHVRCAALPLCYEVLMANSCITGD